MLQALSCSPWIIYDNRTFANLDDLNDLQDIYRPLLDSLPPTSVRGGSIQVTGPTGHGRSGLVKLICQKRRQESSVVLVDNLSSSSKHEPIQNLYRVLVSTIHQIISQRPLLFRAVKNLMAQILRRQAWTIEALKILLSTIFLHSRNENYLIAVYNLERWPSEVQDWWSNIFTLFPDSGNSTCSLVISSLNRHDDFAKGRTRHHIDLTKEYASCKNAFIRISIHRITHSSRSRNSAEAFSEAVGDSIVSAATRFEGSFTGIRAFLAHLFRSFTLSSRSAVEQSIRYCPATEELLYKEHLKSLLDKPALESSWATTTLSWVLLAVRPMHIEELRIAVAINMSHGSMADLQATISMDMERDLKNHLNGLIIMENCYVRLANSLVEEVLSAACAREELKLDLNTDKSLTLLCIHYLTIILRDERPETWEKCLSSVSHKHQNREPQELALVFLHYACQFWSVHFLRIEHPDNALKEVVANFLNQVDVAGRWFELYLLSHGLPVFPLTEDIGSKEPKQEPGSDSGTVAGTRAWSEAALMAGYTGITSIMPTLLGNSNILSEITAIHTLRGFLERCVAFSDETSRHYADCAIADGDGTVVANLLQENHREKAGYFMLQKAAISGRLKTVETLWRGLDDLEKIDEHGQTPLHAAAICGNVEIVRFFVDKAEMLLQGEERREGKAIDAKDENSHTPLVLTTRMGHVEAAKFLIHSGADPTIQDITGKTAMHYAVLQFPQIIGDLLDACPAVADEKDKDVPTPLHIAARIGSEVAAEIILNAAKKAGWSDKATSARDARRRTPLHYAAESGATEIARLLVLHGADTECTDDESQAPAEIAAEYGHLATLRTITEGHSAVRDRLLSPASKAGQLLVVNYLLEQRDGDDKEALAKPLSNAIWEGHKDIVLILLQLKPDVNREDSERRTPLHLAAIKDRREVMQMLLNLRTDAGDDISINIDAPDLLRYTPLHHASENSHVEIMRLLLEHGADVGARSLQGETPLHLAVGNQLAVELLLESQWDFKVQVSQANELGQTPLHTAAIKGRLGSAQLILDRGADMDARDNDGKTPLSCAVSQNQAHLLQLFLAADECRAKEQIRDNLHLAVESSAIDVLKVFVNKSPDALKVIESGWDSLLSRAAEKSSTEVLTYLLDAGLPINHPGQRGRTPLHYAIFGRKQENLRKLIERGADVDLLDKDGRTPLHTAANLQDSDDTIDILLDGRASIDKLGPWAQTALFIAASRGRVSAVESLLERGADFRLCDDTGWSPLHAGVKSIEVTELLVRKKAEVNLKGSHGYTPLHVAALSGTPSVVEFLVQNGADPWAKALAGFCATCPQVAILCDKPDSLPALLCNYVPPVDSMNADLVTTYWTAVERGHRHESVQFLLDKDRRLGKELSRKGLNGLETFLNRGEMRKYDPKEILQSFLDSDIDPFRRPPGDTQTSFELGLMSRKAIRSGFLKACLDKISDQLESSDLGLRELRAAIEIAEHKEIKAWEKLKPLMNRCGGETDQDGWNINHFLYQTQPRSNLGEYDGTLLSRTKTPSSLVWPDPWRSIQSHAEISADGLEAAFEVEDNEPRSGTANSSQPNKPESMEPVISVGLAGEFSDHFDSHPGWHMWSVGYHSDSGSIIQQIGSESRRIGRPFGPGHTVGCGVDYNAGEYIFTLDGEVVYRNADKLIYRKLYPCVGNSLRVASVKVNFGATPFVWEGASALNHAT